MSLASTEPLHWSLGPQGTQGGSSMFGGGDGPSSSNAEALNELMEGEAQRGALLEKAFAPSDAGNDAGSDAGSGYGRCSLYGCN